MKAQRRHELKTNTLAQTLEKLPTSGRKYVGQMLAVCILALLIVVLIRYRIESARRAVEVSSQDLSAARTFITELQSLPWYRYPSQEQIAATRKQIVTGAESAIERVLSDAKDRKIRAEALVARGDLDWLLANFPDLPAATTRPSLAPDQDRSQLLKTAEESYQQVIDEFADLKSSVISAHFGLAAIAENKGDWETAKKHYTAIKETPDVLKAFEDQANERLKMLTKINQPVFLATPSTAPAATEPTTAEVAPGPIGSMIGTTLTSPATQPTVEVVKAREEASGGRPLSAPATQPTVRPTTQPASTMPSSR